jgi:hypothetical protein
VKAYLILDGTLLPIDRIAAERPFYSGCEDDGRVVPAAREHGIIDALTEAGITCWADKGYQGAGGIVRLPYRGRLDSLSTGQQAVNRSHAKVRVLVEQAIATLILAGPPQGPLLDDPDHRPRPSSPHPPSGQLRLRMKTLSVFPAQLSLERIRTHMRSALAVRATVSETVHAHGLRYSRYRGLAKIHVQHVWSLSRVNGRGQVDSRHRARWKQAYGN